MKLAKRNQKMSITNISYRLLMAILTFVIISGCVIHTDPYDDDDRVVANTNYSATEDFYFEISTGNQNQFSVIGINGSIDIVGVQGLNRVLIYGEKRVASESVRDAEAYLSKINVLVSNFSDEILVETDQPDESYGRDFAVFYQVHVPMHWDVFAEHVNGNVWADSISGNTVVSAVNGNVYTDEIEGDLDVDLVNGEVVSTVYLPVDGLCRLTTVNGRVDLSIPQITSADFQANVTNGLIELNNIALSQSNTTSRSVSGQIGSGNGLIDLQTVNGNIVVSGF